MIVLFELVITISSVDVHVPFVMVHLNVAEVPTAKPVTVVVREDGVVIVAVPLTIDHKPEPTVGLLAAMVNDPLLHRTISTPAFEVVGSALLVITTSSDDTVQLPLLMVHLNVAELPAAKPVTVVVGEDGVVIVTVPLTNDQDPVPAVGVLAAMVNNPLLH